MCKDAQFNLRVVGIKEYKTILRDKNFAQQPARLHADRDILQIRVGAADTPGCRRDNTKLYFELELPLIFTLYAMQERGIRVAKEELSSYAAELGERINVLAEGIYADAGERFNINSTKQLGVILFEKLGLSGGKKTKTGYSTAADVLCMAYSVKIRGSSSSKYSLVLSLDVIQENRPSARRNAILQPAIRYFSTVACWLRLG